MSKKEINYLIKKLEEYKEECMSGRDPFAGTNAYWASGFEYFLTWLKVNK